MNLEEVSRNLEKIRSTKKLPVYLFNKKDTLILNQGFNYKQYTNGYILIEELKKHISNDDYILKDINCCLIDALRAYFQQTYDLQGLLITVLLARKLNLLSERFNSHLNNFLKNQSRGSNLYGYINPFIDSNKENENYILYCSVYFGLIKEIVNENVVI